MSSNPNTADISNYLRLLFAEGSDVFLKDYKRLADFFPALVFVLDANEKKLAYTNKQFNTLLGYNDDDISGMSNDLDKIIFKDDVDVFKEELQKCFELKDEESHSYKSRLNHKEGNWLFFKTKGRRLERVARLSWPAGFLAVLFHAF